MSGHTAKRLVPMEGPYPLSLAALTVIIDLVNRELTKRTGPGRGPKEQSGMAAKNVTPAVVYDPAERKEMQRAYRAMVKAMIAANPKGLADAAGITDVGFIGDRLFVRKDGKTEEFEFRTPKKETVAQIKWVARSKSTKPATPKNVAPATAE